MNNHEKSIILVLITTAIVSVAQIFLKIGSDAFELSLNQIYNYPLLGGIFLYFGGAFVIIYAFRIGQLSVLYPIMASGYVMVTLLSAKYLNEVITIQKWVGLIIIIIGVIFIGRSVK
jgi:drug/metabolite transporter (DMT)-like permease